MESTFTVFGIFSVVTFEPGRVQTDDTYHQNTSEQKRVIKFYDYASDDLMCFLHIELFAVSRI